ncbi:MAG: hypothetical protein U5N86_05895 [Planctomycetota bacterium]|nr:hypothetical protein [Planctomycetota bacterium]
MKTREYHELLRDIEEKLKERFPCGFMNIIGRDSDGEFTASFCGVPDEEVGEFYDLSTKLIESAFCDRNVYDVTILCNLKCDCSPAEACRRSQGRNVLAS